MHEAAAVLAAAGAASAGAEWWAPQAVAAVLRIVPTLAYLWVGTAGFVRRRPRWWSVLLTAALLCAFYALRFMYHPQFYLENAPIACIVVVALVALNCKARPVEALFYGSALALAQQAGVSTAIAVAVNFVGDFSQAVRGASPLGWGIEWAAGLPLLVPAYYLSRLEAPAERMRIRPRHLVYLLAPLCLQFVAEAQYMPLIDDSYRQLPGTVTLLVAGTSLASLLAMLFPLEVQRSDDHARERAEMRRMMGEYHAQLERRQESDRRVRLLMHDLDNHLRTMDVLPEEERERYVGELRERYLPRHVRYSGNDVLNLLLNDKVARAREKGVELSVAVDFTDGGTLSDVEVCALFGNALDNAIEAAAGCADPSRRRASVGAFRSGPYLTVEVRNYFDQAPQTGSDGALLSAKRGFQTAGLGLASIDATLRAHDGAYLTQVAGDTFVLRMNVPVREQEG